MSDGRVKELIRQLWHENSKVGEAAVEALVKIGEPAVHALIRTLGNDNESVRRYAAKALGEIRDASAVPALTVAMVWDTDEGVQWNAAKALGWVGDASAVPVLVGALRHGRSWAVRWNAAQALGEIGDPSAVPALLLALGDMDELVRSDAAGALWAIGDASVIPALLWTLGDEDEVVRRNAAEALGNPRSREDLKLLKVAAIKARKEGRPTVGFAVVYKKWSGILNERARAEAGIKRMHAPPRPRKPDGVKHTMRMRRLPG